MHINKILTFLGFSCIISGCTNSSYDRWGSEYDTLQTTPPIQMQYGTFASNEYDSEIMNQNHHMSVLLPMTGKNAVVGKTLQNAIETAILQKAPKNLDVTFYDTASGNITETITNALATSPEIILGPVFSENARILRDTKPYNTPVLSFTSDITALGNGVMTMALMPSNSMEAIISEMQSDKINGFIIMAPDTQSGHIIAGNAKKVAYTYNIPVSGVFYYHEKDSESIKNTSLSASMNTARTAAHTRAKEILSDILSRESLTTLEKSSLSIQLSKLNKSDTIGTLPYNAVLFLGTGDDAKSLASFLRYYNVGTNEVKFYGTTMWDNSDVASDFTLIGAKHISVSPIAEPFKTTYETVSGEPASTMAALGYDATNMALGMLYSNQSNAAYLLNPSGYIGTSGLFRLKPNGASEHTLQIKELDGSGTARTIKDTPYNFITPVYQVESNYVAPAEPMELQTNGIRATDYIKIPDRFRNKYTSKKYGMNTTDMQKTQSTIPQNVTIIPQNDDFIITSEDYQPVKLESVDKKYIDSVEIYE